MMNLPINLKLIIGTLFIFAAGVIFGLYSLAVTQRSLRESVGEAAVVRAREKINEVDKDIFLKIEDIEIYSKDDLFQRTLIDSNRTFDSLYLDKGLTVNDFILQKDLEWIQSGKNEIAPFMAELIYNETADAIREKFFEFWQIKYGYQIYGEVFATNKYGANVAQSGKTTDYYQADEEWWQAAKNKRVFIGSIEYDDSAKAWTMPFGVRVENDDGEFIGVIKAIPLLREFTREVELSQEKYKTAEIKLMTSGGKVISSTKTFRMLDDLSQGRFFEQIKDKESGFLVTNELGKEKMIAFARSEGFRNFAGLGWIAMVEYDTAEVFADVYGLRNTLILISIFLFILISAFIFALSRSILMPLRNLTKASQRIAGGDFDVRISIKSKDEFGYLARSFNKMALELKRSYESLESNVKERTRELQNNIFELDKTSKMLMRRDLDLSKAREQLQDRLEELDFISKRLVRRDFELMQINETLREIDEAKSRFVSIAAHQLRTPISAIKWSLDMLLSGDFGKISKKSRQAVKNTIIVTNRLVSLIGDLLNVARIEEGRFVYKFSEVQIEDVCKTVFNENLNKTKERGISLKLSLPNKHLPKVYADPDNVIIVLQNILDNALNYTLKRGFVEIIVEKDPNRKDMARISIKDNGMGIPDSQKKLVGQKFFRGDNIVRSQIQGTGLGIYIVSKILEKHGSRLQFDSEENKGSVFYFTLPFSEK